MEPSHEDIARSEEFLGMPRKRIGAGLGSIETSS